MTVTHLPSHTQLLTRPIRLILRRSFKHIKMRMFPRPNLQYTRAIPTSITIIGRGPHCAKTVVEEDGKTFHAELVCSEDVFHVVCFEEFTDYAGAECVACASENKSEG